MPDADRPLPPLFEEDLQHIYFHTAGIWEEARGKSFFITGGTGFFGIWLLESFVYINDLLDLGARATILSRDPGAFLKKAPHLGNQPSIELIQGDIRDFDFPAGEFDYLIHAATEASAKLNHESPHEMLDSIITGMRRVLDFASAANVQKFLFTSSGAVYGPQPPIVTHVPESYLGALDSLSSVSAYGEGKRVAELMAAIHAKQNDCEMKIARCWAFVGPHLPLDAHFAIGNFIRDGMEGKAIKINGDGTPCRSYLYAADLTIWLWTILFKGKALRPYNVGSPESYSIFAIAELVREVIGASFPTEVSLPRDSDKSPSRYIPYVERAKEELGLVPCISLKESIAKTYQWHRHRTMSTSPAEKQSQFS